MKRVTSLFAPCLFAALTVLTAGCGQTINTPASSQKQITPSVSSLSFTSGTAQTFTVSEPGYNGTFTASSSDTNVATASISSGASSASRHVDDTQATVTVTPVGGGTATISVSDENGNSILISVSVTGATFTPQLQP